MKRNDTHCPDCRRKLAPSPQCGFVQCLCGWEGVLDYDPPPHKPLVLKRFLPEHRSHIRYKSALDLFREKLKGS